MMSKNITRTFLRTDKMMTHYIETMKDRKEKGITENPFTNWQKFLVKEFKHWVITENEFPYDAVTDVNHMILPKREVAFDWNLLNDDEKSEYIEIKENYLKQNYDSIWESLPNGQTTPGYFHLHLVVLKREPA